MTSICGLKSAHEQVRDARHSDAELLSAANATLTCERGLLSSRTSSHGLCKVRISLRKSAISCVAVLALFGSIGGAPA
jgi:hypothetical protein